MESDAIAEDVLALQAAVAKGLSDVMDAGPQADCDCGIVSRPKPVKSTPSCTYSPAGIDEALASLSAALGVIGNRYL